MRDPREGVDAEGFIVTGVSRDRVAPPFTAVVERAVSLFSEHADESGELLLYGSVATGQARIGRSDVDLLVAGLEDTAARELAEILSREFAEVCRAVQVGVVAPGTAHSASDAAYGDRVFLRHFCAALAGPDLLRGDERYAADRAAARGFNGDIADRLRSWRAMPPLAVSLAKKVLHASAGLHGILDRTWSTDRGYGAEAWGRRRPERSDDIRRILEWAEGARVSPDEIERVLDERGAVASLARDFADEIGLWRD